MQIAVIGIGKLGAPLVAVLASKGHRIIGMDRNPEYVAALNTGKAPIDETGLTDLTTANRKRISATTDMSIAVNGSEIIFIVVPTPSKPSGEFSCDAVCDCVRSIAKEPIENKLIVVVSTVMPGHCKRLIVPAIEKTSGLVAGRDFSFAYCPEFIALGSVIQNMLQPDFILIGESDRKAGDKLEALYSSICENSPPVARMNYINAEIAKIALNAYVTTKISYANMLAEICEQLQGADATIVTEAIGMDSRIGKKYLVPGAAWGGPCFPRDDRAFCWMASQVGIGALIPKAAEEINQRQTDRLRELAYHACGGMGKVAILGLAYKPNTPVAEESAGVAVANELIELGVPVIVYDPQAMDNAKLGAGVQLAESMKQCVADAHVVLIMTPWPEFLALETESLTIDCWRIVDPAKVPNLVRIGAHG